MWYFSSFEGFKPELLAVKVGWNFKKKIGVTKKRHAANFGIWCPKRSSTLANRVVLSWWSFRNPILIIVAVSFFCDAAYFRGRVENCRLCWLWAAITPVQKLRTPISHTFLESSGRQLSHGATHIGSTTSECWVIVGNTKKIHFFVFLGVRSQKIQVAADRTILTPAAFPIAHLKADVLRIPKMW